MIEVLVFPCTYRCDGHCIMCSIHKRKVEDIHWTAFEKFFSLSEMKSLKSVNITGGEPTLREDLPLLVDMICKSCPNLAEIIISTNGLDRDRIVASIEKVYDVISSRISLTVYVSLDAVNEQATKIRGVKNAESKAVKTIRSIKKLSQGKSIELGISCTLTSINYNSIDEIIKFAKEENIYVDFVLATINTAYINSKSMGDSFILSKSQEKEVLEKLKHAPTLYEKISVLPDFLHETENNQPRDCIFRDKKGLLLEADGTIRVCGMSNQYYCGSIAQIPILNFEETAIPSKDFCQQCKANSYYLLTKKGQQEMRKKTLLSVRKKT